jgi:hypothetical protein
MVNFTTQYFLTMNAGAGGSVTPASGWTNSGATVNINASASNGYSFTGWTGTGSGSYSGGNASTSVTMNGPITESASFVSNILVTVQAAPAGRLFNVDGTDYSSTQVFSWVPGSNHAIATTSPQAGGAGVQYVWSSWSDSGAIAHTVAPNSNTTYTANFATQYFLTVNAGAGGMVSPASGWNDSGAIVPVTATASNSFAFGSWTGSGSGSYSGANNPASVTMNAPVTQTASFYVPNVAALIFAQQPGTALQSSTIAPEIQVQAFGTNGQPLGGAVITLSLASGTGNLGGTLIRASDAGGIAHFNDLTVDQPGSKTLAAAANTANTNSDSFTVIGAAVAVAFTTQPGSATAGLPFGQQPVLKTVDAAEDPSTNGLPATLWISISLTNGSGVLLGTTNFNIGTSGSNGVVICQDLAVTAPGTSNQLVVATDPSWSNAISVIFNVEPAGPPPAQSILAITAAGNVTITYATTPGFTYHIEVATNLYPPNWSTVSGSTTNADGASVTFIYAPPPGAGPLYYRTVSP